MYLNRRLDLYIPAFVGEELTVGTRQGLCQIDPSQCPARRTMLALNIWACIEPLTYSPLIGNLAPAGDIVGVVYNIPISAHY
jgi:hypothetical protein